MDSRETLRRQARARRDALSQDQRVALSDSIWKRLVELPVFQGAALALFYLSFGSEVETRLMRELSRSVGMMVACPRIKAGEKSMRFHGLDAPEQLSAGPYGLLQPTPEAPVADLSRGPVVVLVPGLLFDRQGNRLGLGGGYYDRWLMGEGRGLSTVGLAFGCQLVASVPAEAHDVPVDRVLTEDGVIDCRGARGGREAAS